jgi:hypothetical protein
LKRTLKLESEDLPNVDLITLRAIEEVKRYQEYYFFENHFSILAEVIFCCHLSGELSEDKVIEAYNHFYKLLGGF